MANPNTDPVVLLAAAAWPTAELARGLLEAEKIPVLLQDVSRDLSELGSAGHNPLSWPDVLVPRAALERANEILDEAWGPNWREETHRQVK